MSKKLEKACTALNDIEHLLILASVVIRSGSSSTFASSVGIPIDIVKFGRMIQNLSNNCRN